MSVSRWVSVVFLVAVMIVAGCSAGIETKKGDDSEATAQEWMREAERIRQLQMMQVKLARLNALFSPRNPKADYLWAVQASLTPPKIQADSILVVGDSLSVGIGATLAKAVRDYGGVSVTPKGKVGSGLNSPRFFNWESKLRQFIHRHNPDLIVVLIGGNDAYNGPGTPQWAEDFKHKVESFLHIAAENNVRVFWVGLPVMRKPSYARKVEVANSVMESVCSDSKVCSFIDTYQRDAVYTRLRAGDGIHFTFNGYMQLSKYILENISNTVDLGHP